MNQQQIMQIFQDTAYVRMGGSPEELRCAQYLQGKAAAFGAQAEIVPFDVQMADILQAELVVDGKQIPCKGYLLSLIHI